MFLEESGTYSSKNFPGLAFASLKTYQVGQELRIINYLKLTLLCSNINLTTGLKQVVRHEIAFIFLAIHFYGG